MYSEILLGSYPIEAVYLGGKKVWEFPGIGNEVWVYHRSGKRTIYPRPDLVRGPWETLGTDVIGVVVGPDVCVVSDRAFAGPELEFLEFQGSPTELGYHVITGAKRVIFRGAPGHIDSKSFQGSPEFWVPLGLKTQYGRLLPKDSKIVEGKWKANT